MNYTSKDIAKAVPEYTGGGVYAIVGELKDGNYFMGDLTFKWIAVVDKEPNWDDSWYEEWIDDHKVIELTDAESKEFITAALGWVKANKPHGNYLISDIDDILKNL